MRFRLGTLLLLVIQVFTSSVVAQESAGAAEKADKLRLRLSEVQTTEVSLRLRLDQLNEDLKPENIERFFAGIGSTKPEDLRAYRRRQLTIERDGVQAQLKILESTRMHLESAITAADIEAYHASAQPSPASPAAPNQVLVGQVPRSSWSLVVTGLLTVLTISAALLGYVIVRPMISSCEAR